MTTVAVRQSGGANIISIPKTIVKMLGLHVGSRLELSVVNNQIVLIPADEELTLEALLKGSPKECFAVKDEDREWLDAAPIGKEI